MNSPIIARSSRSSQTARSTTSAHPAQLLPHALLRSPIFSNLFRNRARTIYSKAADGSRGSQLAPDFLALDKLIVVRKQNVATDTAALILPAVGGNYERHPKLQRFMLANDSTTIAVEVPVWLAQDDIVALEKEYGIRLHPADTERSITGHIDFLQVRNGAVHILDYKLGARTNKPIAQLTVYALALSRLTGIKMFDIKCAWFNENEYCEFFPRTLLSRTRPKRAA
jgi:ATP-dependent exoDNAse (exonuclease V) beta subunit